jgi:copper transport protein
VLTIAGGFLLATAAPAWAHATLESTSPADQSVVATSPAQISLTYNENVAINIGSVSVYDSKGNTVNTGVPGHGASGHIVVVNNVPKLSDGCYIVVWRVISADSHPVHGAFTFSVGNGGTNCDTKAGQLLSKTGGDKTVGVVFGIARFFIYAGLALLLGGAVFFVLIARGTSGARRVLTLTWVGWITLAVATIGGVMLQAPYAAGTKINDAFRWKLIQAILKSTYGHVAERRLILLVLALPLLIYLSRASARKRLPWWWITAAVIVGLGIAATPGLAGHAGTGSWVPYAVPLDAIHVAAMSVWFGGLVALVACAIGGAFSGGLRRALSIFSQLALWCVIVLILSGLFASWRQVGFTIRGYTDTTYGHLLLIKLAIFAGLIALAAVSRAIVRARRAAPLDAPDSAVAAIDERTTVKLRKSVLAEVLVAVGVLAVTAMLVNAQPARSALAPGLFASTVKAGDPPMLVSVTVSPAKSGANAMHIYTETPAGRPQDVLQMSATLSLKSKGILALPADLTKGGPNHYLNTTLALPIPGKWTMTLHVLRRGLNDTAVVETIPIR